MKRIGAIVALSLLAGGGLAAQDTTKAAAAPAQPAAASVSVDEAAVAKNVVDRVAQDTRSEEHTSELQSRSDLVCRLLLEKKKNKYERRKEITNNITHIMDQITT